MIIPWHVRRLQQFLSSVIIINFIYSFLVHCLILSTDCLLGFPWYRLPSVGLVPSSAISTSSLALPCATFPVLKVATFSEGGGDEIPKCRGDGQRGGLYPISSQLESGKHRKLPQWSSRQKWPIFSTTEHILGCDKPIFSLHGPGNCCQND